MCRFTVGEKMPAINKISWWVPLSFQAAQARGELAKIFTVAALLRILAAIALVFFVSSYVLARVVPDLEFDWLHTFIKCLGLLGVILAMSCLITLVPPFVTITPQGISISQGPGSFVLTS